MVVSAHSRKNIIVRGLKLIILGLSILMFGLKINMFGYLVRMLALAGQSSVRMAQEPVSAGPAGGFAWVIC